MMKQGVICVLGLVIAVASGLAAMGAIAKDKAPALAITLPLSNGYAAENLASALVKDILAQNQGKFPAKLDPVTGTLAKQAFLAEPLTPLAIAVLALQRPQGKKRALMHQAFALSRRQPLVTAWMIADSANQDDIPAILNYYDTMLRTNNSASSAIFPLMATALAEERFIEPLADLLNKNPPWASGFWNAVISSPGAVRNAARLRTSLDLADGAAGNNRDARLVGALIKEKQFEAAENLYQTFTGQQASELFFENGTFDQEPKFPPVDWQLFSTGEYGAVITAGYLELSAIRSSGGLFARQIVKLPPAIVAVEVTASDNIPEDASISINISCAEKSDNPPLAVSIPVTDRVTRRKISNSQFQCEYYWFEIAGRAEENSDGFDIGIQSISLRAE